MIVDIGALARTGICDYAPGHSPRYLSNHKSAAIVHCDAHGAALIVGAGLRQVGRQEAAAVMGHVIDRAVNRKPIGMHIERRHEDRHHHRLRQQPFALEHTLHGHHLAVDRADHAVSALAPVMAFRTSEEIEHKHIYNQRHRRHKRRDDVRGHEEPHRHVEHCQHYEKQDEFLNMCKNKTGFRPKLFPTS